MNLKYSSVAAFGLLLAGLGAWAAPMEDEPALWRHLDTRGKSAVVVELSQDGTPFSRVVILEGEKGSLSSPGNETAIALVAEWCDPRGDRARLGVYRVEDQHTDAMPRSQDWLEDVELTRGGSRVDLQQTARVDGPSIGVRLIDTILPNR